MPIKPPESEEFPEAVERLRSVEPQGSVELLGFVKPFASVEPLGFVEPSGWWGLLGLQSPLVVRITLGPRSSQGLSPLAPMAIDQIIESNELVGSNVPINSNESVGYNESFESIEKVRSNETVGPVKMGLIK